MRPPFRREVSNHLVRCVVSSDTRNQAFRGLISHFDAKGRDSVPVGLSYSLDLMKISALLA